MNRQQILIVGSGAMACLFAARLSAIGEKVVLLGSWKEGIQAIQNNGITLIESDQTSHTFPVEVTDQPTKVGHVKYAIVLVKAWQTNRAGQQLQECLAPDGVALTLQNGMGNRELLAQHLGAERVALGIATLGAHLTAPGQVQYGGMGKISLTIHDRVKYIRDSLQRAGFTVEDVDNPDSLLWGKLVVNSAMNPLTALLGIKNGEILERPTARALMINLARETAAVAYALGIPLPFDNPTNYVESVAQRTAQNYSSMLQDVRRGAPTEIDAICGAIVRAGEQAGVPTPLNETLWQLIKALVFIKKQL